MKRKNHISSFFKLRPSKQRVGGSNPSRDATKLKYGEFGENHNSRANAFSGDSYDMSVLERMLFSETIKHFITANQAEGKSPSTGRIYQSDLVKFHTFLGNSSLKLLDITSNLVRSFLAAMLEEKEQLSGYTVHQYFRVLRTFFKWCVSEGFLPANVMENIKPPRLPQKVIATFSVEVRWSPKIRQVVKRGFCP